MATRAATHAYVPPTDDVKTVTWEGLLNGDDGNALQWAEYADRSVQVIGTFGAGGTLSIQGSNDGTNWEIINDPQGNVLTFTAAKIEAVMELTRYVRPIVTAGDGTTDLDVILCMRK